MNHQAFINTKNLLFISYLASIKKDMGVMILTIYMALKRTEWKKDPSSIFQKFWYKGCVDVMFYSLSIIFLIMITTNNDRILTLPSSY